MRPPVFLAPAREGSAAVRLVLSRLRTDPRLQSRYLHGPRRADMIKLGINVTRRQRVERPGAVSQKGNGCPSSKLALHLAGHGAPEFSTVMPAGVMDYADSTSSSIAGAHLTSISQVGLYQGARGRRRDGKTNALHMQRGAIEPPLHHMLTPPLQVILFERIPSTKECIDYQQRARPN